MKFTLYLFSFFITYTTCLGQETVELSLPSDYTFFSDAISKNINLYKINSQVAYEKKDIERADFLYDSLINNCLKGTYFDNFVVNKLKTGEPVYIESFTKPIYLRTTASWCQPNDSEIEAFNDIANEFGDIIDFVFLYWDPKANIEAMKKNYNDNISVVYVDEIENYNSLIIHTLKHSLGLPSIILMDQDRKILDIDKGAAPVFTPTQSNKVTKYGTFNPPASKEHFIQSYTTYFDSMAKHVNEIITNM